MVNYRERDNNEDQTVKTIDEVYINYVTRAITIWYIMNLLTPH